ncbi:UNVERIFIED_CONTAM: hypothetical protein FKN15_030359 [Acipenser sinensis]
MRLPGGTENATLVSETGHVFNPAPHGHELREVKVEPDLRSLTGCLQVRNSAAEIPPWPSLRQKPPTYDGKSSWETYITQFEIVSQLNNWTEEDKGAYLATSLKGEAMNILATVATQQRCNFIALCQALALRYGVEQQVAIARMQLRARKREVGETLPGFAGDLERLFRIAYPGSGSELQEQIVTEQFIEGLDYADLRIQVKLKSPKTLREALLAALQVETVFWAEKNAHTVMKPQVFETNVLSSTLGICATERPAFTGSDVTATAAVVESSQDRYRMRGNKVKSDTIFMKGNVKQPVFSMDNPTIGNMGNVSLYTSPQSIAWTPQMGLNITGRNPNAPQMGLLPHALHSAPFITNVGFTPNRQPEVQPVATFDVNTTPVSAINNVNAFYSRNVTCTQLTMPSYQPAAAPLQGPSVSYQPAMLPHHLPVTHLGTGGDTRLVTSAIQPE